MLIDSITQKVTEMFPDMESPVVENAKVKVVFEVGDIKYEAELMTDENEENWEVGEINTISNSESENKAEDEVGSPDDLEAEDEPEEMEDGEGEMPVKLYTAEEMKVLLEEKACLEKKVADLEMKLADPKEETEDKVSSESVKMEAKVDMPDADGADIPKSQKSVAPFIFGEPPHYGFTL